MSRLTQSNRGQRGPGTPAALIADAERVLRERGVTTAWLACAIGSDRAARFYEKSGWQRAATTTYSAETTDGQVSVDVSPYEKTFQVPPGAPADARRPS